MLYQKEQSFKEWIVKEHLDKNTKFSDLARDINDDPNFPDHSNSIKLLRYLRKMGACDSIIYVFNQAFNVYLRDDDFKQLEIDVRRKYESVRNVMPKEQFEKYIHTAIEQKKREMLRRI